MRKLATTLVIGFVLGAVPRVGWAQTLADSVATLQAEALREDQKGTLSSLNRARELWMQVIPLLRRLGDRAAEARTLSNIGRAHRNSGRPDSALLYVHQGLAISRQAGDHIGEGRLLNNIGSMHRLLGRPDTALAYYRQGLAIQRKAADRAGEGTSLNNIGNVHLDFGRADSALASYHQSLGIRREVRDRAGEGLALHNIAGVHLNLGRLDSALIYYRDALAIRREVGDRPGEGRTLRNVGEAYSRLGRPDSALAYYREAQAIERESGDRSIAGQTLNSIGLMYNSLGRPDSALAYLREALTIERKAGNRHDEGITLNYIANVYSNLGHRDSARVYYDEALTIRRALRDRPGEGLTLQNIGFEHIKLGRPDSAMAYLRQALAILREVRDRETEVATLTNIGFVHRDAARPDSALAYYRQALAIARAAGFRAGEATALQAIGRNQQLGSRPDFRTAVAYYDSATAMLASIGARAGGEANRVSYAEQQTELFDAWTLAWLAREKEIGNGPSVLAALAASERGRAQALLELMRQTSTETPAGRDLADEGKRLIEPALRSGVAVLSYLVTADTILVWLAVPGRAVELTRRAIQRDTLAQMVGALREFLGVGEAARGRVALRGGGLPDAETRGAPRAGIHIGRVHASSFNTSSRDLAAWLLPSELSRKLRTVREVVIIPHGVLGLVPFAALPVDPTGTPFGRRHALRFAPSLAVLAEAEGRPGIEKGALGVGSQPRALVMGNPVMPETSSAGDQFRLSPLPGAEAEARGLASQLGTAALIGPQASETQVRAKLPAATIVHLATHGYAYATDARVRRSFIAMAPGPSHDGFLTVAEVLDDAALNLSAELVVLSACQTGLGDLKQAEGTVGFQRAFLARGARSVLVSMWSVSDAATAFLMKRFYAHWLSDSDRPSKAEALRRSQDEVRKMPGFQHPRFWAAFQLAGAG